MPTKQGEPRPSGSAAPLKSTRTKFTAEDDLILRRWVASNERKGESVAGNVIYKELADKVGVYHIHHSPYVNSKLNNLVPAPYLSVVARPVDQKIATSPSAERV